MKFSVIMPTMNRNEFAALAAESILAQDADLELIIQDAGDDSKLKKMLPLKSDFRIIYTKRAGQNIAEAVNAGIRKSTGDLLMMACDDDLLLTGALKAIEETLEETGAKWCYGKIQMSDGRQYGEPWNPAKMAKRGNIVPQPACCWRKDVMEEVGYWDTGDIQLAQDYEFWLRLGIKHGFKPAFIDQVLSWYTVHSRGLSVSQQDEQNAQAARLRNQYNGYLKGN